MLQKSFKWTALMYILLYVQLIHEADRSPGP